MIDFHCHLDLYPKPHEVVERCRKAGVYVLSVTTTPKAWRGTSALAADCPRIRTALGFHPELAAQRMNELPLFEALVPEAKYIGEIGLDGSPDHRQHLQDQLKVFDAVLMTVHRAGGRVMSIHSRGAVDEVLAILARYPDAGTPVLHWFSGSHVDLRKAIAAGTWFSVGPAMLRGARGRSLVSAMPRNRVLPETDGPFATTRGRPLEPTDSCLVYRDLASLWGLEEDDVVATTRESFARLLSGSE